MRDLSIDIETYCEIDIGNCGSFRYIEDDSFEIVLFAYSVDFGEPICVDFTAGETIPMEILMALFDSAVTKRAFNAGGFEWPALSKYFGLSREQSLGWLRQWKCDMVHSYYLSYAGGLDTVGKAVGIPQDKQKLTAGKALIRYFCQPCKPTKSNGGRTRNLPKNAPEKWALFKEYNIQDVVAENAIYEKIKGIEPPDWWWNQWYEDMEINSRGAKLDREFIEGAIYCNERSSAELMQEFRDLTGLDNPNSNVQLLEWLHSKGVSIDNLQKATVENMLAEGSLSDDCRRALELRQLTSKTSTKKYYKMLDCISPNDDRVRGLTQYAGASRTNRWAGRLLQVQNLKQCHVEDIPTTRELIKRKNFDALKMFYGDVEDTTSQMLRIAFIPEDGHFIVDCDYSSVEARISAWIADETAALEEFRGDGLIYELTSSLMYGVDKMDVCKGGKLEHLRKFGKICTLACAFGGGAGSIAAFDNKNEIPEEQRSVIVKQWRDSNPNIVKAWYAIGESCMDTIKSGRTHSILKGKIETSLLSSGGIRYLRVKIPSGRYIHYANPEIVKNRFGGDSIGYSGMEQVTRKWGRIETYQGKIFENIVQGTARDLLADSMSKLMKAGYKILFSIHDEVCIEAPEGDREEILQNVRRIMNTLPEWASDFPVDCDGWYDDYFRKG